MAELKTLIEDNDFSVHLPTATTLGPALSRAEIEAVLTENSKPFPTANVSFYIINSTRFFFITYYVTNDMYMYLDMGMAS